MGAAPQLLDVVGLLYDAALDEIRWPAAMRSVADFAGAAGTFYFVADQHKASIVHSELEGVDPSANDAYLQYYGAKDARLGPALRFPVGHAFGDDMLPDWRAFTKSEIFAELLAPYDIPHIRGVWVAKRRATASAFIFERSFRQGPFDRHDSERCSSILPHVIRAVRTREALAAAKEGRRIYVDLLDRLPFGTILLDAALNVIEASAAARSLLDDANALSYCANRVRAQSPEDDARLQSALAGAVAAPRAETAGDSLRARRRDGGRPIHITVVPVASPGLFSDVSPAVMLLVVDPAAIPASPAALMTTLGLTEAEASLVAALATGVSLRQAADQLAVSINTCKSQLKSVYAKMGWRSHSDLTRSALISALGTAARPE